MLLPEVYENYYMISVFHPMWWNCGRDSALAWRMRSWRYAGEKHLPIPMAEPSICCRPSRRTITTFSMPKSWEKRTIIQLIPAKRLKENGTDLLRELCVCQHRSSGGSNSNITYIGIPLKIHDRENTMSIVSSPWPNKPHLSVDASNTSYSAYKSKCSQNVGFRPIPTGGPVGPWQKSNMTLENHHY